MHKHFWGIVVGTLVGLSAASVLAAQAPAGATAKCKDDTYSTSTSHRGACKGHGGVADWLAETKSGSKATSTSKTAAPTETASTGPAPADATAKCKDGSYSTSASHRGACKGHGGVGDWLADSKSKTMAPPTKTASAPTAAAPAAAAAAAPAPAKTTAAPKTSVATTTPPAGAPADASAECKDGSYSHAKHHRGACSKHGGVQQWLKDIPE
ncbi:MAG TPA: DUF3761 domain-containing protein [Gemmatimonadales bacterium]|jgi:hypothetical protein